MKKLVLGICLGLLSVSCVANDNSNDEFFEHFLGSSKPTKDYFTIVTGCNFPPYDAVSGKCCVIGSGEDFCFFKAIKPLHIRGVITFIKKDSNIEEEECYSIKDVKNRVRISIKSPELNTDSHIILTDINDPTLTKWYKSGKENKVSYEAEFDIINKKGDLPADKQGDYAIFSDNTMCGNSGSINIVNLKLGKKI